ncbi:MAG: gliding motility-associated C-terminal domain-containing protein, partial [Psychroserpens sp.]|nr:gliding motility-associated C-terminal domain-containing protein [Psychroserpens sp.]
TWNLISVTCTGTTGPISCGDILFSLNGESWNTFIFDMPAGATITVETILNYEEPQCNPNPALYTSQIRSAINIIPEDVIDIDYSNNFDDDFVVLLPAEECPFSDLTVTKTQIDPQLPLGGSDQNPMPWGNVTYEITASNISNEDTFMTLVDLYASSCSGATGILRSVECISSTGGASCGSIEIQNIDVEIDQNSEDSVFWEITEADNWFMPAGSSVTFRTEHTWIPDCDSEPIPVINNVNVLAYGGIPDGVPTNNGFSVTTYFTPCVDLIIQTFPSVSTTPINSTFDWVVDITNSNTSSTAIDASFSNNLNPAFSIVGAPSCQVENGTATCLTSFNVTGSNITGTIPLLEAGSTIRIRIPVQAPNYGGVFNNTASVFPSAINNEELTPETNISISSAQIVSPNLEKNYNPETIYTGGTSTLTFTINNTANNPAQTSIAFTDYLAPELNLVSTPAWVNANGCTANFIGVPGDDFVGVTNLSFPEGVSSCSFSVEVTSNVIGIYLNDNLNFSDQNNIDTTQTSATLNVVEDTTDVDIEVLKTVSETSVFLNDVIDFTITATNIGTTTANQIEILESLPSGYQYISHTSSFGSFDLMSSIWSLSSLAPNQSESLTLTVRVISSEDLLNVAILNQVNEVDRDETNNEDSAETSVDNCLNIPQGISPNNDGLNELFFIPCLELYPKNSIKIYNRYGTLIFQADNYKNDWDGSANRGFPNHSGLLPVGTYFYVLELSETIAPRVGWIYLNY